MSSKAIRTLTSTLVVPLTFFLGCGDTDAPPDGETNPRIDLTSIEVTSADELYLLHPVEVAVEAELEGAAYEADVVVGLRTVDGGEGCVIGSMRVSHTGETASWQGESEFMIPRTCYQLVDADVELFVSFDPWNQLGDRDDDALVEIAAQSGNLDLYAIAAASALGVEGCETCETTRALYSSPGLDAQLQELHASSGVAVIPVAGEDGVEPDETRYDLALSSRARVVGLDDDQPLDDGQLHLRHTIRPLGSSDEGLPLIDRGRDLAEEATPIAVRGHGDLVTSSALSIEGQTRDAIVDGTWSDVSEFEVVTCVEPAFDQAVYLGESAPREDDCGALPIVVVREPVGAGEQPQAGAASSNKLYLWSDSWSASSGRGFGTTTMEPEAWAQMASTDNAATSYKGTEVHSPGVWFEAGFAADGQVFGQSINYADIYATFIAYEFAGGGLAMGASLFTYEIIPEFVIQMYNGVPLSLQEILDASGVSVELSVDKDVSLYGIAFNDDCGTVNAGVWLEGEMGIDANQTTVTSRTTNRGLEVEAVITPYVNISAQSGFEVTYDEYFSGSLVAQLDILHIDFPSTGSVEVVNYDPLSATRLIFENSAVADFSTLSGSMSYSFIYEIGLCPQLPLLPPHCWYADHTDTIASWNGIDIGQLTTTPTLSLKVDFGTDTPASNFCMGSAGTLFSGDFDGDGNGDYLCHNSNGNRYIDYGSDGIDGTDWSDAIGFCSGSGKEVLVGDFDGDGIDDIECHGTNLLEIDYAADGFDGVDWSTGLAWCNGSVAGTATMRAVDFNGDGRADNHCYRYSDGNQWVDYADQNGQFAGADWSGATVNQARIRANWNTNVCLNVLGNRSTQNNTDVAIYNGCSAVNEWWNYDPLNGKIRAAWDGDVCLDVAGTNATANGTNVAIYDCSHVTETWYLDPNDSKLHARWDNDVCLDVAGANSTSSNTNIQIWHCDQVTETWTFVEVP
jgi:hypothetical protein